MGEKKPHAQNTVVFKVEKKNHKSKQIYKKVCFPVRGKRKEHFALNLYNIVQVKHNKTPNLRKPHT